MSQGEVLATDGSLSKQRGSSLVGLVSRTSRREDGSHRQVCLHS
jgi:hypothetical protein